MMIKKLTSVSRAAISLLVTLLTTVTATGANDVIELTFAGRGDATTADQVTVTNLTNPDIAPVTLSGSATLRLVDVAAAMRKGDVNVDNQVGIGDIVAITNVMAGSDTDAGLKTRSDVNGDGTVGIGDIVAITNLMAGNFGAGSTDAGAVTMQFSMGDILRFEGTSGQMRTLMHLSPESSHAVYFDFFRCQDAAGYNYPIVRIGDMLWMMEDLRPQTMTNLINTSKVNVWKNVTETDSAFFVSNGRAYYNVPGARKAMPSGWEMPSIDEMYALVKEMEVDTLLWGDFLKDRTGYEWDKPLLEGPDTVHLQLLPNGYIDATGNLTDEDVKGAWLTRNTMRHGCPVCFEINALNTQLYPMVIHEKGCGFTVRGCRPAPSVYTEMLEKEFVQKAEASARRKLPMQLVNDNGPLGAYYTFGDTRQSVFFDYTSDQYGSGIHVEQRSGVLFKKSGEDGWTFESKNLVPTDVNGNDPTRILRKVTAQGNADGYENVVYATWSKPFRVYFDGTTKNAVPEISSVMGEGVVNITVFGDSIREHAILDDYATRPLLDKDGKEYIWAMPTFNGKEKLVYYNDGYYSDVRSEYFARAFNLRCIQDQTGDGVEEIVMNVGNKIAVFDGVTLRCLREREYADEGSYIGTANLRYDVADVNGDGYEDIVMVVNTSDIGALHVYSQGHVDEEPIFVKHLASKSLFCDVKVGNMSNSDLPEIAILTRGLRTGANQMLEQKGCLYVSRLMYDDNQKLTEKIILAKTEVNAFASSDALCRHVGNMDLVFGYFRGREYTQDLIVGDGLWRWDETDAKPTYRFQVLPLTKSDHYTIAADAIATVPTPTNNKETLMFIWNINVPKSMTDDSPLVLSEFGEMWLENDGTTVKRKVSWAADVFGWGKVGEQLGSTNWTEQTKFYYYSSGNEMNSHPTLCKFADRDRPKKFKFKNHELNFSEPRIYAVLAAPPYYKDLGPGGATTWGKTSTSSNSTATSDEWGGSVIAGYEHSFSVPFFSSLEAGVEFTAKVSVAGGIADEHEVTMGSGQEYAVTEEHSVVMQATPFDTYRYEIFGSDDPDEEGMEFVVSMPRERAFVLMTLSKYVRLMASQKNVARPQRFLTSTPGNPWSYPMNYDNEIKFVDDAHPFLKGKDMNQGYTNEQVPEGTGNSATRSLSMATSDSKTKSVSLEVETELVATVGGAKAGVGFNYGHTKENTHTIGQEFSVGGTVSGVPDDDNNYKRFRWNVVWYYVKDAGGIYPVVNYIVTP